MNKTKSCVRDNELNSPWCLSAFGIALGDSSHFLYKDSHCYIREAEALNSFADIKNP